ncbi:MAG: DUF1295 domain-containing protein [Pseudomonadota bacterium]
MNPPNWFDVASWGWMALAVLIAVLLLFVDAPYGRHGRRGWGPEIQARLGWLIMESVSPLVLLGLFAISLRPAEPLSWIFAGLWLLHYGHRAWIFPFRLHSKGRRMPVVVMGMAMCFNAVNASLNGLRLFVWGPVHDASWLTDPRLGIGLALFAAGLVVNLHSDTILIGLRRGAESGYQVPRGGLFCWVSCPNYLGEILEWCGWALATWSLAGLSFAVWTVANLAPRALAHHRWYKQQFSDYPAERRALIPFVL